MKRHKTCKTEKVDIRITKEEKEALVKLANICGYDYLSEFIRDIAVGKVQLDANAIGKGVLI
jgi:uncharacterized protein (DUF1778 family)